MATIREIRRQLHSVINIQKITQAMEMVAASRLRRAQAKAEKSRPYAVKLKEVLDLLIAGEDDLAHPLMAKREVKKTAFVVIAGDRGLCGGYNQAVFQTTEKLLKDYRPDQVELILVGRKAINYFSGKKWKVSEKVLEWGGKITYHQIEELTQSLINHYLQAHFDEVKLIYTRFINLLKREVMTEKLLRIDDNHPEKKSASLRYIFEPNPSEILAELLPHYCITKVLSALNEAYASELAARIFSMRAATKNAEEMIENLTLIRNRLRQTSITKELIEITSYAQS